MRTLLETLGLTDINPGAWAGGALATMGEELASINPSTNEPIARVWLAEEADYDQVVDAAVDAQVRWRQLPAPRRGEIVRQMGDSFRHHKAALGELVSLEVGKIRAEGAGEVQETIDIADFSVGLSRQLYGLSMHSERPGHRMYEQWHPLGTIGVISAFNFPNAVWAWNAEMTPSAETPWCGNPRSRPRSPPSRRIGSATPCCPRTATPGCSGSSSARTAASASG